MEKCNNVRKHFRNNKLITISPIWNYEFEFSDGL